MEYVFLEIIMEDGWDCFIIVLLHQVLHSQEQEDEEEAKEFLCVKVLDMMN